MARDVGAKVGPAAGDAGHIGRQIRETYSGRPISFIWVAAMIFAVQLSGCHRKAPLRGSQTATSQPQLSSNRVPRPREDRSGTSSVKGARNVSKIDRIKREHYVRYLPGFSFGAVAERYLTLSPADKQLLAGHVRATQEYLRGKGRPASGVLLELVCLAAAEVRSGSREDRHLPRGGSLSEKELARVAYWLDAVTRCVKAYDNVPLADRRDLVAHAKSMGVALPLQAGEHPLPLLAALYQVSDHHHQAQRKNPFDLVNAYRQLSVSEGHQLASDIIGLWQTGPDLYRSPGEPTGLVEDILLHLACLVPGAITGLHDELIDGGLLYPTELFRDADSEARERLIELVQKPPHDVLLLGPLAWIGDEVVQRTFHRWRQSPPVWDPEIGFRINNYFTRDAGWQLTKRGGRRDLYHRTSYRLIPAEVAAEGSVPGPVEVITDHSDKCVWCGRRLLSMFDIQLGDPRLSYLAPGWKRLRIALCSRCTGFGTIYTDVDPNGGSRWSKLNVRPHYIGTEEHGYQYPPRLLVLGPQRRSPFEAHQYILSNGASQLGGFPMWIQGNRHPDCPKCHRLMVFVGQIQTSDALGGSGEGCTYAFLCQECRIAATTYEQT
jgi:hypothetical protein